VPGSGGSGLNVLGGAPLVGIFREGPDHLDQHRDPTAPDPIQTSERLVQAQASRSRNGVVLGDGFDFDLKPDDLKNNGHEN
jgi:hypothetical protein